MMGNSKINHINLTNLIWGLCCFACCITGNEWSGAIVSLCRYIIFFLLFYLTLQNKINLDKGLYRFSIGVFLSAIFCTIYNTLAGYAYFDLFLHLRQTIYFLLFIYCGYYIAYKKKDSDTIFKTIHYISIMAAWIIILQFVFHLFNFYLNRIPIAGEVIFKAVDTERYFRPSAFFSEPSYFAEICLVDLFSCLFKKRNLKIVLLELIALVLSTSTLGIGFGYILLVLWSCKQRLTKNIIISNLIKLLMIGTLLIILTFIFLYEGDSTIVLRIQNGATINQRMLRAFEIFYQLDVYHMLFGIGMQNMTNYLNYYSINLVNEGIDTLLNREYAQSFGYVLCTLGIPGATAFGGFLIFLYSKCTKENRYFFVVIFGLCLTASIITRIIFIIYITIMYCMILNDRRSKVKGE